MEEVRATPILTLYAGKNYTPVAEVTDFELDYAYGDDENDFELTITQRGLSDSLILSVTAFRLNDNHDIAGWVDAIQSRFEHGVYTYTLKGTSLQGLLDKTLCDFDYTLKGDMKTTLTSLITEVGMSKRIIIGTVPRINVSSHVLPFTQSLYQSLRSWLYNLGYMLDLEYVENGGRLMINVLTNRERTVESSVFDYTAVHASNFVTKVTTMERADEKDPTIMIGRAWYKHGQGVSNHKWADYTEGGYEKFYTDGDIPRGNLFKRNVTWRTFNRGSANADGTITRGARGSDQKASNKTGWNDQDYLTNAVKELETVIDDQETGLTAWQKRLTEWKRKHIDPRKRLYNHYKNLSESLPEKLEKLNSEGKKDLNERLEKKDSDYDARLKKKRANLDKRIAEKKEYFAKRIAKATTAKDKTELQERLDKKITYLNNHFNVKKEDMHTKLGKVKADMKSKYAKKQADLEKRISVNKTRLDTAQKDYQKWLDDYDVLKDSTVKPCKTVIKYNKSVLSSAKKRLTVQQRVNKTAAEQLQKIVDERNSFEIDTPDGFYPIDAKFTISDMATKLKLTAKVVKNIIKISHGVMQWSMEVK